MNPMRRDVIDPRTWCWKFVAVSCAESGRVWVNRFLHDCSEHVMLRFATGEISRG